MIGNQLTIFFSLKKKKTNEILRAKYTKSCGRPQWLSSKESACNAGDAGLIPRS